MVPSPGPNTVSAKKIAALAQPESCVSAGLAQPAQQRRHLAPRLLRSRPYRLGCGRRSAARNVGSGKNRVDRLRRRPRRMRARAATRQAAAALGAAFKPLAVGIDWKSVAYGT